MKSYVDRVAVIAGAGSGVARVVAFRLAQRGCHLALADMDGEALEQPRVRITDRQDATRVEPSTYVADGSTLAMQRFSEQVSAKHGSVNLLFNDAG
jgi:NAD(P)-dependent dehydrogenase (short-subunit alcohol dehydrogenase family)